VVWVIWFCAYFINYGLVIWLTTIFRTVYKLPLDVSLRYGLIIRVVGDRLVFAPPLVIESHDIEEIGQRLERALDDIARDLR